METGIFTKEQRNEIYKETLKHFKENGKSKIFPGLIYGMCSSIYQVINKTYYEHMFSDINAKNFPEFFEFKPKRTWEKNSRFWFTRYVNYGGYDKRVSILTALVEGKTPEEWEKEWKASGRK